MAQIKVRNTSKTKLNRRKLFHDQFLYEYNVPGVQGKKKLKDVKLFTDVYMLQFQDDTSAGHEKARKEIEKAKNRVHKARHKEINDNEREEMTSTIWVLIDEYRLERTWTEHNNMNICEECHYQTNSKEGIRQERPNSIKLL